MSCFCRNLLPQPDADEHEAVDPLPLDPLIPTLAAWLSARWLPGPEWEPNPDWLDVEWAEPTVSPAALAVLTGLSVARNLVKVKLDINLDEPRQRDRLVRVVATLNERTEVLAALDEDQRPWQELLVLNAHVDAVQAALDADLFENPPEPVEPFGPWREMLPKVKALAPLVSIGELLEVDWKDPAEVLASRIRALALVRLPALANAPLVLRVLGKLDAIARLKASLGADPRPHPFERVEAAVRRKAQKVKERLPRAIQVQDGILEGLPHIQPNPFQVLNEDTVAKAREITPRVLERLTWQVPDYKEFSLLMTGLPVVQLASAITELGVSPVRDTPCGRDCDAARAMRTASATAEAATATPGSGTGAVPAR